jgi:hypothetical protein
MRPARLACCVLFVAAISAASPAFAWWQFVSLGPDGRRDVHSPYPNEAACQTALKIMEAQMKKRFPDQFPLVGSCEEYRGEK